MRVEEVFSEAAKIDSVRARAAYLDRACFGDARLRERVEALLAAHDHADSFLETSAGESDAATSAVATLPATGYRSMIEGPGAVVGRYKLLQQIGEGGMGVVYMAEQEKPVRRRVALKIIKPGMDSQQVIARFEAERQALAMMDHPNIARVLDAGTTDTGRPYFVMELVQGIPITQYCDDKQLDTHARLELFIQVCNAIQHAHQKGIIHRDLKPSNVLIAIYDARPVPKIIDFGVAKALHQRLTERTMFTQFGAVVGTLEYMSPEQADMDLMGTDTRSDIYSLGVLLYELLTGSTPLDGKKLRSLGYAEMLKTIREVDPPKPSTRLSQSANETASISAKRHTEPRRLQKLIAGDLDWIVMKCLDKDRTRRYETANGLAMDIQRHLQDEAVTASPPGQIYKLQKLVRRNKLTFAAIGSVVAALVIGLAASVWQAERATRATHKALAAESQAIDAQVNERQQRQLADAARQSEALLRQQAEAEELYARQRAYAANVNLAKKALAEGNLGRALDLLNQERPGPGQRDLRGWEWRYLWRQTRSDALFTLCQQSSQIVSLAASADGNWLAITTRRQGGVSVWDLRNRQESIRLGENGASCCAAFSPTEPLLAFAGPTASGPKLRLWNAATRQMVGEFPLQYGCKWLVFAKDGRTLATCEGSLTTNLWRVPDGTKLASYQIPNPQLLGVATDFAVTPDLGLAAYGINGGSIGIVNLREGRMLWTAVAGKLNVTALAFSPDGKILATAAGFDESDIRLWDVATAKEIGRLQGHGSWVSSLVFWPDGKKLASGSADQTIRIWDVSSRTCLDELRGHQQQVWRLALSPDDKTLVSGCKDGTVCFWDTSVTHLRPSLITVSGNIATWCFTPDSAVLTLDRQGRVVQWTGPNYQIQEPMLELGTDVYRVTDQWGQSSLFSQDGRFLAAGPTGGIIGTWDVQHRVLSQRLTGKTGVIGGPICFLAQGNMLITGGREYPCAEWNLSTGLEIQTWPAPLNDAVSATAIAASPDGRWCVTMGSEGEGVIRNLVDKTSARLDLGVPETIAAAFSPDGKQFAATGNMGYARVWETANWRPVVTVGGFLNAAHSVAFSPDGKRLAIDGGEKEALKLCDTESWQDLITLEAQGSGAKMAFSPDGNAVGFVNTRGVLQVWRAPSWAEINAAEKAQAQVSQTP
jgi:serine/threonine protein kinase/WD40 repeat protein